MGLMALTVILTIPQIEALIEAATDQASLYRDSEDADPSFHLQKKARSLETAVVRLRKPLTDLDDLD
jgi:hypothetical protein